MILSKEGRSFIMSKPSDPTIEKNFEGKLLTKMAFLFAPKMAVLLEKKFFPFNERHILKIETFSSLNLLLICM